MCGCVDVCAWCLCVDVVCVDVCVGGGGCEDISVSVYLCVDSPATAFGVSI
jgi:hypothetical protein